MTTSCDFLDCKLPNISTLNPSIRYTPGEALFLTPRGLARKRFIADSRCPATTPRLDLAP